MVRRRIVAVTGASGHLGEWVLKELIRRGHEVLAISRSRPTAHPELPHLRVDLADPLSIPALAQCLQGVQSVIHLAGRIPEDTNANAIGDAFEVLRTNAEGTVNLLAGLKGALSLESVIFASTFEVYGMPQTFPISEDHPTEPLSFYGASKLTAEKYVGLFAAATGVPAVSLRLPAIYGPGDRLKRAIGNFIRNADAGKEIVIHGDGSDRRELVFVTDAAVAVAECVERRPAGILNVGSGTGVSIREMAEAVRVVVPGAQIRWEPRMKPNLAFALSCEAANVALGWASKTSLLDGIRAQLDWIRSTGQQ